MGCRAVVNVGNVVEASTEGPHRATGSAGYMTFSAMDVEGNCEATGMWIGVQPVEQMS